MGNFSSRRTEMNRRNVLVGSFAGMLCAGILFAQNPPAQNVSPEKHGNLAAAQRFCDQALQRITAAQQANGWDLAGHAEKAKDLLNQASRELTLAAEAADKNHK
jgi:DNA-binding transcriptional regulator PaaX